ncbi:MAG: FtsQ-type POTRA domain-containing protein [Gammaproteobacteria bacterium]|nr:FtsQ-type POTRA domain-containing protein [Gammaproteobacteria bacterium]
MSLRRKHQTRSRKAESVTQVTPVEIAELFKLFAVAGLVIAALYLVSLLERIPVKSIVVNSVLQHVDRNALRAVVADYSEEGFFTVDLAAFEKDLENMPWVFSASIKRRWPSELSIVIEEQKPLFRWRENALLNQRYQVFEVGDVTQFEGLVVISGNDQRSVHLAGFYRDYADSFEQLNLAIDGVYEDGRYDKRVKLANGIILKLSRRNYLKQMRLARSALSLFPLKERAMIAEIDLRHSNGFAVQWKQKDS